MPKRKQNRSAELVRKRADLAMEQLAVAIKSMLHVPFVREVAVTQRGDGATTISVRFSWRSILGLGLFGIWAKLRIYRYLNNDDPLHASCYVRTHWLKG